MPTWLPKTLRQAHQQTVHQFFALAHQHVQWESIDLVPRLDEQAFSLKSREESVPVPAAALG